MKILTYMVLEKCYQATYQWQKLVFIATKYILVTYCIQTQEQASEFPSVPGAAHYRLFAPLSHLSMDTTFLICIESAENQNHLLHLRLSFNQSLIVRIFIPFPDLWWVGDLPWLVCLSDPPPSTGHQLISCTGTIFSS